MSTSSSTQIPDKLARIISLVFHPVFMPLYGLIILLSAPTFLGYLPVEIKKILIIVVLVNNVLIPLALLPLYRLRNLISSYSIEDRRERIIPLAYCLNPLLYNFFYCIQLPDSFLPEIIHFCNISPVNSCINDQLLVENIHSCCRSRCTDCNRACAFHENVHTAYQLSYIGYPCRRPCSFFKVKA